MRKIISILILSLFIYNTIGFLALHPLLSVYYKHLGLQNADKPSGEELIELLVFSKEDIKSNRIDFKWIHSREFRYNGVMYDIVKKEENEKQLYLFCINDTKEKKLEEDFEKRVHQNSSENKERPVHNNHHNIILSEPVQEEQIDAAIVSESMLSNWMTDNYKSPHLDIPSPPPRPV